LFFWGKKTNPKIEWEAHHKSMERNTDGSFSIALSKQMTKLQIIDQLARACGADPQMLDIYAPKLLLFLFFPSTIYHLLTFPLPPSPHGSLNAL